MGLFKRHSSSGSEADKKASARSRSIFRLFHQAVGSGGGVCSTPPTPVPDLPPTPHPQSSAEEDDATESKEECSSSSNNHAAAGHFSLQVAPSANAAPIPAEELPLLMDSHNAAKGGNSGGASSGDGGASSGEGGDDAFHASALDRFKAWQQIKRPNFRFGPRKKVEEDAEEGGEKNSRAGSFSSKASEDLIPPPSKSAFVYQDGKFVEREVSQWPRPNRVVPHARYRAMEPYASQYGQLYQQRIHNQRRLVSPKHRLIYETAIYRLPKRVMEENKRRLMRHHNFKNRLEGAWPHHLGPQVVDTCQRSQVGYIKKEFERQNQKDAEHLVNYLTRKDRVVK